MKIFQEIFNLVLKHIQFIEKFSPSFLEPGRNIVIKFVFILYGTVDCGHFRIIEKSKYDYPCPFTMNDLTLEINLICFELENVHSASWTSINKRTWRYQVFGFSIKTCFAKTPFWCARFFPLLQKLAYRWVSNYNPYPEQTSKNKSKHDSDDPVHCSNFKACYISVGILLHREGFLMWICLLTSVFPHLSSLRSFISA